MYRLDKVDNARYVSEQVMMVAFVLYSIIVIGYYGMTLVLNRAEKIIANGMDRGTIR